MYVVGLKLFILLQILLCIHIVWLNFSQANLFLYEFNLYVYRTLYACMYIYIYFINEKIEDIGYI